MYDGNPGEIDFGSSYRGSNYSKCMTEIQGKSILVRVIGSQLYIKKIFSRCAYMDATLLDFITRLINLDFIPFTSKSKDSKYIHLLSSCSVPGKCVSDCPPSMCFSSITGI